MSRVNFDDRMLRAKPGKGWCVLLVEDDEINRQLMQMVLGRFGFKVQVACDGSEAMDLLKREKFHCLLLDVKMPGMNGYDTARFIRKEMGDHALHIIAITAHAAEDERQKCLGAGMNDFISKPFDPRVLVEKILGTSHDTGKVKKNSAGNNRGPLNMSHLDEITHGDLEQKHQLVEIFLKITPAMLVDLENLFAEKRYDEMKKLAHKIRSGASVMIAPEHVDVLEEIEYCEAGKEYLLERKIRLFTAVCREAFEELKAIEW
jgi:CheY-like chemotaxis protein